MKKILSLILILVFMTACNTNDNTDKQNQDGIYIYGWLSYHVFFESKLNKDLDKNLIKTWHNKDNSVTRIFYQDGTYVWLINAENAGAIINSKTWTSNNDNLILSLNQYNKTTK